MHSISLCDEVTLTEAGGISLSIKEGLAPGKANLMWDAAELFFRETGFSGGVHMELVKQIPSEAGMGGGSSDAAAVLRGLNRMTGQRLSLAALADMGARLGPMFLSVWQEGAGVVKGLVKNLPLLPVGRDCP